MLKKGNKLYSILTGTCPKCHDECMYVNKNTYKLSDTLKMHERCSDCNTKYKKDLLCCFNTSQNSMPASPEPTTI
jgi:uncharacterized protein (DUF983 family)